MFSDGRGTETVGMQSREKDKEVIFIWEPQGKFSEGPNQQNCGLLVDSCTLNLSSSLDFKMLEWAIL